MRSLRDFRRKEVEHDIILHSPSLPEEDPTRSVCGDKGVIGCNKFSRLIALPPDDSVRFLSLRPSATSDAKGRRDHGDLKPLDLDSLCASKLQPRAQARGSLPRSNVAF